MKNVPLPSQHTIRTVMKTLGKTYRDHPMHAAFSHDPFQMLIAVVLSQRATDAMTIPVAKKLFQQAPTAKTLAALPTTALEEIIQPIGFFRQKSRALKKLCRALLQQHDGSVPLTESALLALPQVGRKTANIILTIFGDTPQIAVDVHVHRITHRLGWVRTKTPEQTEVALMKLIPHRFHKSTNHVFVRHGQLTCRPIAPWCSRCPVSSYCPKIGVERSR